MFRIALRDLFWATLAVALGLGWWAHVRQLQRNLASVQSDLLYQADFVDQFVSCFKNLGCEIPPDSDPRCANGGPYTRIFFTDAITKATGCISSTLSGPRSELQRTLDGEYGSRYRNSPAVQAARAARGEPGPVTGQPGQPVASARQAAVLPMGACPSLTRRACGTSVGADFFPLNQACIKPRLPCAPAARR